MNVKWLRTERSTAVAVAVATVEGEEGEEGASIAGCICTSPRLSGLLDKLNAIVNVQFETPGATKESHVYRPV